MSGQPKSQKPGWFSTIYSVGIRGTITWAFSGLAAGVNIARGSQSKVERTVEASTMIAFETLKDEEIGAVVLKAANVANPQKSTFDRIMNALGVVGSASAAKGCDIVLHGAPEEQGIPPQLFKVAFGSNAVIDAATTVKRAREQDPKGAAISAAKAVGNVYQAVGGVQFGIQGGVPGLMYGAAGVSLFQAGLDIADQVRTRPGEATAEEQRGLLAGGNEEGGRTPSPTARV